MKQQDEHWVSRVLKGIARGIAAGAAAVVAWFKGGKDERGRRMRQRAVPLAIIAFVSGLTGLIVGGTSSGGPSSDEKASEAQVRAESINQRPRVIGCEPGSESVVRNGSRTAGKVALTFDDGPGPETREVMEILLRYDAGATFFVTGDAVINDPETIAQLVLDGFEVGSHSMSHEEYPGPESLTRSQEAIHQASGFRPCLFRPPYGLTNASVEAAATEAGMASILWDVDTSDYAAVSADEILAQTATATSGSILVMHDGPENREATVEALPQLIEELQGRGYELVSVTELLDQQFIPAPR